MSGTFSVSCPCCCEEIEVRVSGKEKVTAVSLSKICFYDSTWCNLDLKF